MTGQISYTDAFAAYREGDLARCHDLTGALVKSGGATAGVLLLRAISTPDGEPGKAAALNARSFRLDPYEADNWFNYGVLLEQRGRLREAAAIYRRALALDPCHLGALLNGTQMLRVNEFFEETLPHARRLQQLTPDNPAGFAHEAIALQFLDRLEESDRLFDEAKRRSSDPSLLHWEHHFSLLKRGRFAEAWECYETRFACAAANGVDDMAFTLPRWDGGPSDHVLVYGEQGIGDQLMFASALDDLARKVAKVSLVVAPAMERIFAASFPHIAVYPITAKRDPQACAAVAAQAGHGRPVEHVLPLGSLPHHFRNDRSCFNGKPYLRPSEGARAFWQAQAGEEGRQRFRIGLCWACNPALERFYTARRAVHRTMPFHLLARLAEIQGVGAISVNNVPMAAFGPDAAASTRVADVSNALIDIDRTAALLENIDLLITVDTGVAHLAGALGVPVWILLHKAGDPRWGQWGETRSYWYDSARLYWQNEPGDWDELVDRVDRDLRELMARRRRGQA